MSSCNPCLSICSVPVCTDEIIIGTIADVNTDIYIVVHNRTTNRKEYVSSQSDGAGLVTLVTSGLGLMPEHSYELAIIPRPGSPCDKYTITVGEFTGTCLSVSFENAKDMDGCVINFPEVTLEVIEEPVPAENCVCVTQEMVTQWNAASDGSKIYRALISQSGAGNPPTAIIQKNDFTPEVFTFAYDVAGKYKVNSPNNSFTANKTFARINYHTIGVDTDCILSTPGEINIGTCYQNPQVYADDLFELTPIEIIVTQ